jgi:hypothetical protein
MNPEFNHFNLAAGQYQGGLFVDEWPFNII